MPKKDPITGCEVMTLPEFLNAEGAREGRSGCDILEDIFKSMDEDSRNQEEELRKNALTHLQEGIKLYRDYDPTEIYPMPTKLVEVLAVKCSQKMRSSSTMIEAICEADDAKTYKFKRVCSYCSGSFYEPPDSDDEVTWELACT